jgi:ABC-type glycerol-3-phosphate transport system substrate-binding protein
MTAGMASFAAAEGLPKFDDIQLGTDYVDLQASIKMLTHRTDLEGNGTLAAYVAEFNKVYPGITVEYEAVTDYAGDALIRLAGSDNWGDIMMIPEVDPDEYATYFAPLGDLETMKETYNFIDARQYDGVVYGIPSTGNAQGIVYNKAVFAAAGITELPKTPAEFIADLQLIKDNTEAIPLYTNYAAGWTMGAWDAYLGGTATGNPNYMKQVLVHSKAPFADPGNGAGPYNVYKVLYDASAQKLIEDDYTTTDWESCKGMINRGEIGCMVLGSWAFSQMRDAGDHGADIGYMTFPITVDGKQYASAGADYSYGINAKAELKNQIAAMIYVKWLTYESGFAYNEGGIPIVKTGAYPDLYAAFADVTFVADAPALPGEELYLNDLNAESTLMINAGGNTKVQSLIEAGFNGTKAFDDIMADWNTLWSDAQVALGITAE